MNVLDPEARSALAALLAGSTPFKVGRALGIATITIEEAASGGFLRPDTVRKLRAALGLVNPG